MAWADLESNFITVSMDKIISIVVEFIRKFLFPEVDGRGTAEGLMEDGLSKYWEV